MENSSISWTDHTFSPWIGCTKISPACDGCYAAHLMGGGRYSRVEWGEPGKGEGTRSRTAPGNWAKVRTWNRKAAEAPGQTFVFCSSLADVFDNAVEPQWRRDLFDLIRETPNLTWLLLTKRPQLIVKQFREVMQTALPPAVYWPKNILLGTTIEDKKRLANAFALKAAAVELDAATRTFWSCEPLLEDLGDVSGFLPGWVITGGETDQGAHKARPADPAWYRSLRDQCAAAGVPFHFKQNGEWVPIRELPPHPAGAVYPPERPVGVNGEAIRRVGKANDPCTLDGVTHDARPAVAA